VGANFVVTSRAPSEITNGIAGKGQLKTDALETLLAIARGDVSALRLATDLCEAILAEPASLEAKDEKIA
jgi:hypothetical protein